MTIINAITIIKVVGKNTTTISKIIELLISLLMSFSETDKHKIKLVPVISFQNKTHVSLCLVYF